MKHMAHEFTDMGVLAGASYVLTEDRLPESGDWAVFQDHQGRKRLRKFTQADLDTGEQAHRVEWISWI